MIVITDHQSFLHLLAILILILPTKVIASKCAILCRARKDERGTLVRKRRSRETCLNGVKDSDIPFEFDDDYWDEDVEEDSWWKKGDEYDESD